MSFNKSISALIECIQGELIAYPNRERDIQMLNQYIENGDDEMSESLALRIIEQQRAVHNIETVGLPPRLAELQSTIEKEECSYPSRQSQLDSINSYIRNGDIEMAESVAEQVVEQQRNLHLTRERGLPNGLEALFVQVRNDAVDYPNRQGQVNQVERYLSDGDYEMARSVAENIVEQQKVLSDAERLGVPSDLKELLETIEKEKVPYPNRSRQLESINDYFSNGDHDMTRAVATDIVERQRNLNRTNLYGLPVMMAELFETLEGDRFDYPDRHNQIASINIYLQNGDYDMAVSIAKQVMEQQQSLRCKR